MNFDFSFVPQYIPYYLQGVKYTLLISLITVLFGALFGSVLFFMKSSNFHIWKIKPLKIIAVIYIEIIRGTPMLLQILIMYIASKAWLESALAMQVAYWINAIESAVVCGLRGG